MFRACRENQPLAWPTCTCIRSNRVQYVSPWYISFSRGEPLRAERRTRYSTRSQQEKTRRIEKTIPHTGATCYNRPRQRKHGVSSFTDPATRKDTSSTLSDLEDPSQWPKSRCRFHLHTLESREAGASP